MKNGKAVAEVEEPQEIEQSPGTMAVIHKADIEQQVDTARRYPRSVKRFRDECLDMVTLTEEIAQGCIYALPRGGKVIEGPSARFAEVIASAWGNCRAAARVVSEDREFVTAQGAFHDLERNVAIQYEVRRRITNKRGDRFDSDMIAVTANAACSIALRNAVLKGIPKSFWSDMYEAARKTAMGDVKTLTTRRAEALNDFKGYGIMEVQICTRLGVAGQEDIGLEELVVLRAIYASIKDGEITPEHAFPKEADVKTTGSISLDSLKPSQSENRGHDATQPQEASRAQATPAGPPPAHESGQEHPAIGCKPCLVAGVPKNCQAVLLNGHIYIKRGDKAPQHDFAGKSYLYCPACKIAWEKEKAAQAQATPAEPTQNQPEAPAAPVEQGQTPGTAKTQELFDQHKSSKIGAKRASELRELAFAAHWGRKDYEAKLEELGYKDGKDIPESDFPRVKAIFTEEYIPI